MSSAWHAFLDEGGGAHIVQLHEREDERVEAIVAWARGALARRGGALLVGMPSVNAAVLAALGATGEQALREGRLVAVDADELLSHLVHDGEVDAAAFHARVGALVERVRGASEGELRAWGSMVDILTSRGERAAAIRLEEEWNRLLARLPVKLLCTYALQGHDVHARDGILHDVLGTHTHVHAPPRSARANINLP